MPTSANDCHLCHIHDHNSPSTLLRTSTLRDSSPHTRRHHKHPRSRSGSIDNTYRDHHHGHYHHRHDRHHHHHHVKSARVANALARLSEHSVVQSLPASRSNTLQLYPEQVSVLPDGGHRYIGGDRASVRSLELTSPRLAPDNRSHHSFVQTTTLQKNPVTLNPDMLTASLPPLVSHGSQLSLNRQNTLPRAPTTPADYFMQVNRLPYKDDSRKHRFNLQTVMLIGCYTLLLVMAIVIGVVLSYQNGWLGFGSASNLVVNENASGKTIPNTGFGKTANSVRGINNNNRNFGSDQLEKLTDGTAHDHVPVHHVVQVTNSNSPPVANIAGVLPGKTRAEGRPRSTTGSERENNSRGKVLVQATHGVSGTHQVVVAENSQPSENRATNHGRDHNVNSNTGNRGIQSNNFNGQGVPQRTPDHNDTPRPAMINPAPDIPVPTLVPANQPHQIQNFRGTGSGGGGRIIINAPPSAGSFGVFPSNLPRGTPNFETRPLNLRPNSASAGLNPNFNVRNTNVPSNLKPNVTSARVNVFMDDKLHSAVFGQGIVNHENTNQFPHSSQTSTFSNIPPVSNNHQAPSSINHHHNNIPPVSNNHQAPSSINHHQVIPSSNNRAQLIANDNSQLQFPIPPPRHFSNINNKPNPQSTNEGESNLQKIPPSKNFDKQANKIQIEKMKMLKEILDSEGSGKLLQDLITLKNNRNSLSSVSQHLSEVAFHGPNSTVPSSPSPVNIASIATPGVLKHRDSFNGSTPSFINHQTPTTHKAHTTSAGKILHDKNSKRQQTTQSTRPPAKSNIQVVRELLASLINSPEVQSILASRSKKTLNSQDETPGQTNQQGGARVKGDEMRKLLLSVLAKEVPNEQTLQRLRLHGPQPSQTVNSAPQNQLPPRNSQNEPNTSNKAQITRAQQILHFTTVAPSRSGVRQHRSQSNRSFRSRIGESEKNQKENLTAKTSVEVKEVTQPPVRRRVQQARPAGFRTSRSRKLEPVPHFRLRVNTAGKSSPDSGTNTKETIKESVDMTKGERNGKSEVVRQWSHMDVDGTMSLGAVREDGSFAFTNCRPANMCRQKTKL